MPFYHTIDEEIDNLSVIGKQQVPEVKQPGMNDLLLKSVVMVIEVV